MQRLLEMTAGIPYKKKILLYGAFVTAILSVIIISAVVLNTNALLLDENEDTLPVQRTSVILPIGSQSVFGMNDVSGFESIAPATATIKADGQETEITYDGTVKSALLSEGVILYNGDAVIPDPNNTVKDGDVITVTRAKTVTITKGGKNTTVKLTDGTVNDAIALAGVELGKDEILSKSGDSSISDGLTVKISKVTYKEVTQKETVKFKTVTTKSGSLESGKSKVTQKGVNGEKEVTYKVKYVDGKETNRTVVSEKVLKKAVDKKVTVGTKKVATTKTASTTPSKTTAKAPSQISWISPPSSVKFDSNGKPASYKKIMTGTATAYGPKDGTATSTGRKAQPGYVAVDPRVIPYGTRMYIVSSDGRYNYGYAIAADTGGAARSGRILVDLFFPSNSACYQFGRRQVKIYILP